MSEPYAPKPDVPFPYHNFMKHPEGAKVHEMLLDADELYENRDEIMTSLQAYAMDALGFELLDFITSYQNSTEFKLSAVSE